MLSAKDHLKLLTLHRVWPDRVNFSGEDSAESFHQYLRDAHAHLPLLTRLESVDEIRELIEQHRELLYPEEQVGTANLRRETRIDVEAGVLLTVVKASSPARVGTTVVGSTINLCPHGMAVSVPGEAGLSRNDIVEVTVTARGVPISIYKLHAESEWAAVRDQQLHLGLSIKDDADFTKWRAEFESRIAANR